MMGRSRSQCLLGTGPGAQVLLTQRPALQGRCGHCSPSPCRAAGFQAASVWSPCVWEERDRLAFYPGPFQYQHSVISNRRLICVCGWKGGGITSRLLKVNQEEERVVGVEKCRGPVGSLVLVLTLVPARGLSGIKTALQEVSGGSKRSFTCIHSCPPSTSLLPEPCLLSGQRPLQSLTAASTLALKLRWYPEMATEEE